MPDYSACQNQTCPKRHSCARYLMIWSEYHQSVGAFEEAKADLVRRLKRHYTSLWPQYEADLLEWMRL